MWNHWGARKHLDSRPSSESRYYRLWLFLSFFPSCFDIVTQSSEQFGNVGSQVEVPAPKNGHWS